MWALLSFPTVKTLKSQSPSRDMWGNHFLLAKELSSIQEKQGFCSLGGLLSSGRALSGDHHAMRSYSHKTKALDRCIPFPVTGPPHSWECRFSGMLPDCSRPCCSCKLSPWHLQ